MIYLDNERLLTTGFSTYSDRQIAIWNHSNFSEPLHRVNIDSSSGILFPYYDYDTKMVYLAGKVSYNVHIHYQYHYFSWSIEMFMNQSYFFLGRWQYKILRNR